MSAGRRARLSESGRSSEASSNYTLTSWCRTGRDDRAIAGVQGCFVPARSRRYDLQRSRRRLSGSPLRIEAWLGASRVVP